MLHHLVLGGSDVVRNTVESDDLSVAVVDGVAGLWVAVPGLADTARIDN